MNINYQPIGIIHSPFTQIAGMPIQPTGALGIRGTIEIFAEYAEGLADLEGFSHVILLYHFHQATKVQLLVTPFMDSKPHGIFATRAPNRPNPIGLSIVKLLKIEGNVLHIENVDILDGTPLLDIKPYVPEFDYYSELRTGWLEHTTGNIENQRSDSRFVE
ncbi:MAG: tRNA (N6-threonylcarbamoyladenosine(37)-N6)-methyltransferase TrmO [candidate division KSB1 bacterium]|nr:tRNA (N6-threonylcarbamoyladenosine(37)-N6)-methyltransferase TrmO [candidate division KSB1 bacterium]